MLYKILNNYFSSDFHNFFTYTNTISRGHQFELFKSFSTISRLNFRSDYFFNRILNDWNGLPDYVVNASSINCFESLLDSHLANSRFIFV